MPTSMPISRREAIILAAVLLAGLALRCIRLDQPIVENDIGRQIPTAMVARNLDRGSGYLRPQLDTGPFPNYFLVEPPIYQALVVGLSKLPRLSLECSGRLVSALGLTLGAIGLWWLTRSREGPAVALIAALAISLLPVSIRYGRAFQPDPLCLGLMLGGMAAWDAAGRPGLTPSRRLDWMLLAWCALAIGLAVKVLYAFMLVPLMVLIRPGHRRFEIPLALLALGPAALWYLHAARLLDDGSPASAQNASIWRDVLNPANRDFDTSGLVDLGRSIVRAYSPLGLLLAVGGWSRGWHGHALVAMFFNRQRPTPEMPTQSRGHATPGREHAGPWFAWGLATVIALLVLAPKLHHGYYWLMATPLVAVGIARALAAPSPLRRIGRIPMILFGLVASVLAVAQARSTFSTPAEWVDLKSAGLTIGTVAPAEDLLIAPEALLYFADRRGCRLEWSPDAQRRAASEWGATIDASNPLALIEHYRERGATHLAELPARLRSNPDLGRRIRARYRIIADRPDVLVVALESPARSEPNGRP